MQKSLFAIVTAAFAVTVLSGTGAHAGPYPYGDQPYRLNWQYNPEIASGCLKWNWQEYQWNDSCPVYVYPEGLHASARDACGLSSQKLVGPVARSALRSAVINQIIGS